MAAQVVEQRLSHFMMGLAILGVMTGPLLVVLHTIPRSLFAGVFFVVGVSIASFPRIVALHDQLPDGCAVGWPRIKRYHEEDCVSHFGARYIQRSNPLLQVSKWKVLAYISFQLFGVLSSVAVSQTLAAIGKSHPCSSEAH